MHAGPSTFPGCLSSPSEAHPPTSPGTLKHHIDSASNPDLATPSKQMRLLGAGLANTSSGSFLVTKAQTTHLEMKQIVKPPILEHVPQNLEHPDWTLLSVHESTTPSL